MHRKISAFLLFIVFLQGANAEEDEQQLTRIQASIQAGDLRGARAALDRLLASRTGDPRAYNLLGVVDAQENRTGPAEENFRRAIEIAPRFTGAYLNLGCLYQEQSSQPAMAQKGLAVYRKLLAFDPSNEEANYQAATLLARFGKYEESLACLGRLPAESQQRAAALALRCVGRIGLGTTPQKESACQQFVKADDISEPDVLPLLPVLHKHSANDFAVSLLGALARRGLLSSAGWQALAEIEEQRGNFKEARAALEQDLQLQRPSAPALIHMAKLAYQSGDLEGAVGYLAHARDLEPQNAAIHFFFGLICVDLKLPPEAKKSLSEAVRLEPGTASYHYALGAVLLQEREADAAAEHFRHYRDAYPADPRGRFALGVAYFDANQPELARKELEAAAQSQQTAAGANLYLGRLALRDDDLTRAEDRLQVATHANPTSPEPLAELALVQIRRNDYTRAESTLNKSLQISPDHYRTNLNLLMLYQRTKDARTEKQQQRVKQLEQAGEERERLLLRSLEIRPY